MERAEMLLRLEKAKQDFLKHDLDLLKRGVHELALTGALLKHLRPLFEPEGWHLDPEYDKREKEEKRLRWRTTDLSQEPSKVRPDIIVHHRGRKSNLLIIEAKKAGNDQADDLKKLIAFQNDVLYEYEHAALVRFITGDAPSIEIRLLDRA